MIISISLIFETLGIGDIPIQLRVTSPSGEALGIIHGMLQPREITIPGQINTIALTAIPLPIPVEGNIVIDAR
jgi:hypothetical protein